MKFCPVHQEYAKTFKEFKKDFEFKMNDVHRHTTVMNSEFGNIQKNTQKILKILEGEPGNEDCPGLILEFDRLKNKYESNNKWIMGIFTLIAAPVIYLLIQNLIK